MFLHKNSFSAATVAAGQYSIRGSDPGNWHVVSCLRL